MFAVLQYGVKNCDKHLYTNDSIQSCANVCAWHRHTLNKATYFLTYLVTYFTEQQCGPGDCVYVPEGKVY